MSKELEDKIKSLEAELEKAKQSSVSATQQNLLQTLDVIGVKDVSSLRSVLQSYQNDDEYEDDDDDEYDDEYDDDDDEEEERVARRPSKKEKAYEDRIAQLENLEQERRASFYRNKLSDEILKYKAKYPYLAAKAKNQDVLDNIFYVSQVFHKENGHPPEMHKVLEKQNETFKTIFEQDAKSLGLNPAELPIKIPEANEEITKEESKPEEKKELTNEEFSKLSKVEQMEHFKDNPDFNWDKPAPKEEESGEGEKEEKKQGKVTLPSGGGAKEAPKGEELSEKEKKMIAAGFNI